jgi:hypothetical protein
MMWIASSSHEALLRSHHRMIGHVLWWLPYALPFAVKSASVSDEPGKSSLGVCIAAPAKSVMGARPL